MTPLFASLLLSTTLSAPLPPEPKPDPLAWGYMGVRVHQESLIVSSVEPNTPANKAGLLAGDEIVEVGLLKPKIFDEVVQRVCDFRPGTRIKVVVARGEKQVSVTLELVARPTDGDILPPNLGGGAVPVPFAPIPK